MRLAVIVTVAAALAAKCLADEPATPEEPSFRGKIVFFGNATETRRLIETMNLDGSGLHTVFEWKKGEVGVTGGRISPDGRFAAFTVIDPKNKKSMVWLLTPGGIHQEVLGELEGFSQVTAWSPGGKQVAIFRGDHEKWENFVLEIETHKTHKLALPATDVVGDWAPGGSVLTAMAGNVDKSYLFGDGEEYPVRGLYLINPDGSKIATLTNEPTNDFIWARFSPDGRRIAYYRRYYKGRNDYKNGHAFEACVIADSNGSNSRDVVCFTKLDPALAIKPAGQCCWTADGKTIVWMITKRPKGSEDDWKSELVLVDANGSGLHRVPLGHERDWWGQIDCH